MGENNRIEDVKYPKVMLEEKEPTLKEIKEVVTKARTGSALALNRRKGEIPSCWQIAKGCFVPKDENSKELNQFWTISLLNVEGKIFFAVLARRLTTYLVANGYIDTSVQKGGIPGFSGCVEHTSTISQLIREAKENKGDLTVVWLDLANAYCTVPHKLIEEALQHYHITGKIQAIINNYLKGIHLHFSVQDYETSWLKLEKGIVTGCTISVLLFVMAMNLIIGGKRETRGHSPAQTSGNHPVEDSWMI